MNVRTAGDFDYDARGGGYAGQRRTDPRIAALVHAALGQAETVLNVGAGAGSYEPEDRDVTAVEPSASMRSQRPAHLGPAIDATAGHLPFAAASFDAAMAMVTIIAERRRYPAIRHIRDVLGGASTVTPVPVPADCVDGFTEAYFARPERFLDPAVRQSQSAWGFVEEAAIERGITRLRADLDSGAWDRRYGTLRTQPEFTGSLRLITAHPG
jgi:hypothetical protein